MKDLTIEQIMQIEGICVRFIQKQKREVWRSKDGQGIIYKENKLGCKYLITFDNSQGITIAYSLKRAGVGDTIQKAFNDYLAKNSPKSNLNP